MLKSNIKQKKEFTWRNRIVSYGSRPAKEFNFNPENWRTHPPAQRDALNEILHSVGWVQGVIVNARTNRLIDGQARIEEALELGEETFVPYTEVDLSPEEERLILLLLDPIGAMAQTNAELFQKLSESLTIDSAPLLEAIASLSVPIIPFTPENLLDSTVSSGLTAFELNKKWQVKPGDLWQIGSHRLLCGDATETSAVRRLMNGETAELLFTSPPYKDQRTYSGKDDLTVEHLAQFIPVFAAFCKYQIVNLGIKRIGSEIDEYWQIYIAAAKSAGYKLLSWNIWDRGQATGIGHQTAMFAIDHEWLFVFGERVKKLVPTVPTKLSSLKREKYRHRRSRRNRRGELELSENKETTKPYKHLGTVIHLPCANTIGESAHPAMFPVELPAKHIEAMTHRHQIVCEPFAGAGTTMVASENLGRRCYAMEISPEYVAVCLERMSKTFHLTTELIK